MQQSETDRRRKTTHRSGPKQKDRIPGRAHRRPLRFGARDSRRRHRDPGTLREGTRLSPVRRAIGTTFGSLRIRNYRLFISGQLVSLSGTWMQTVALGWLVLELGGSGFDVGLTYALQFLPILLAGMWGGVLADHFDKRILLIATQSAMAALAVVLFTATATGVATLSLVYVFTFLLGCVTAVDNPARQSFVTEMVRTEQLANAVGLNSAVFNASRILGPALAGVVIATVGLPSTFLLNSVTYVAVIYGLWAMDPNGLYRSE